MVWIYLNSSSFWKKTATLTPACVGSALGEAHPLYSLETAVIPHRSQLHKLPDWRKLGLDHTTTIYSVLTLSISLSFGRRIDAFELWCWRRLLRVPWTARKSGQSILKEISSGCPLEGLMLKLKLLYFGHLMWRTDSFEKTLRLGKIESGRWRGRQRMRWLDGIANLMDMNLSRFRELIMDREARRAAVHGVSRSWTWLSDWTELNLPMKHKLHFDVGEACVFLTQESCLISPYLSLMLNNRNNA